MASPDDDREIRNLISRVARLADTGTIEQYLELFTDDARFEIPGRPTTNGLEELRERVEAQRAAGAVGPSSGGMHLLGTSEIVLEGDRAVAYTPWAVCRTGGDPGMSLVGRYEDELARTATGWKLRRRSLVFG